MHGKFSTKSDVFSFGVILLEIVSGLKNYGFHQSDLAQDLPSYPMQTPLKKSVIRQQAIRIGQSKG
ncbi:putative serine/threonine-protein kinase receptor [Asimina triloba]